MNTREADPKGEESPDRKDLLEVLKFGAVRGFKESSRLIPTALMIAVTLTALAVNNCIGGKLESSSADSDGRTADDCVDDLGQHDYNKCGFPPPPMDGFKPDDGPPSIFNPKIEFKKFKIPAPQQENFTPEEDEEPLQPTPVFDNDEAVPT